MAYISFEHKDNIENHLKRSVFQAGSGGDYIHCEIVLCEYGNYICSSWYPDGVQIRPLTPKKTDSLWENFDLGSCDKEIFDFFYARQGVPYTVPGLVFNMKMNGNFPSKKSFCSQICLDALKSTGHFNQVLPGGNSHHVSPNDLYKIISKSFTNTKHFHSWH